MLAVLLTCILILSAICSALPQLNHDPNYHSGNPQQHHHRHQNVSPNYGSSEEVFGYNSKSLPEVQGRSGDIIYPSGDVPNLAQILKNRKSDCIHGLCSEVEGYPEEYLLQQLEKYKGQYDIYFKSAVDLGTRVTETFHNLCTSSTRVTYPKTSNNTKNQPRLITNVKGNVQGVPVEICGDNAKCRFLDGFPNGYEVKCVQKMAIVKLLAVSPDGEIAPDFFNIPSCCVCEYRATSK